MLWSPRWRLGHTTPGVALRYQHATLARDRAIADRLRELMRAAETAPAPLVQFRWQVLDER